MYGVIPDLFRNLCPICREDSEQSSDAFFRQVFPFRTKPQCFGEPQDSPKHQILIPSHIFSELGRKSFVRNISASAVITIPADISRLKRDIFFIVGKKP